MARFPSPLPNLVRGPWDEQKRRDLYEFLRRAFSSLSALNVTAPDPVEIQAGVSADPGASLGPANALHVHPVDTAAPSVNVSYNAAPDEGSGTSLMRADARLRLADGSASGDVLVWNGSDWVSTPGSSLQSVRQTEIDFGATPVAEASFTVADSTVTALSQIIGSVAYEAPTGKDLDELEMDGIDLKFGPGVGQLTIYARGMDGYVADKFKINYIVG